MIAVMVFGVDVYDSFLSEHEGEYIACMFNLKVGSLSMSLNSGVYMIASNNLEDIFYKVNENIHNLDYYFIVNQNGVTIRDNTPVIKV